MTKWVKLLRDERQKEQVNRGKMALKQKMSNLCEQLISNASVYHNSAILSRLLERPELEGNVKGIDAQIRISPLAALYLPKPRWNYADCQAENGINEISAIPADNL
ncbi:Tn3 family transposase [Erwinia tasmaniensis]|uniref:Tn3 family transposase n=1 Tax=Erwinia tasmaniensis TaxID=338565 RepID=UPI0002FB2CEA|nr:Tn3 family transposase [Erwinia tasmaniensis]